ncbi:MAG TPA: HD domain-containing protein [Solirubrobacteraceae bacterium]|jgi:HD superfamily phosphohydrolase|nr:HD domain-containing protein [Solirubrobacteraceae bacterium]
MPEWGLTKEMRITRPFELGEWWLEPGKVITDPVHGDIFVTRLEQAFLDTPPMQRLRRVRQLGATHLVYPGATHTRFAHSLGAVRAVQDLLDMAIGQRNRNHAVADLFDEWEREERRGDTTAVTADDGLTVAEAAEVEDARTIHLRKLAEATVLARLGALLHDVGHLPYGHSIEDDLDLLTPHDENTSRFHRLWAEMISAIEKSTRTAGHRRNWPETRIQELLDAFAPLREGGKLYTSLRPLILSKERDESGNQIDPVDLLTDYPFVADIVGNTICADLLDYLQRDHRFTGLPMSLGQRFMSSFYVIPGDVGGIYKRRMALLIHREGRPRQDVVTEIIKHLRYRYELQERVLVHHLKLTADAMIGKMIEFWHEAEKSAIEALAPEVRAAELAKIPSDFTVETSDGVVGEVGQSVEVPRLRVVTGVNNAESSDSSDSYGQRGAYHMGEESERLARWRLEQMLLERGDDGVLEHMRFGPGQDDEAATASRELAGKLLERSLYQHAANATAAFAAKDLYKAFGSAARRRELERKAARHAGLDADWHVILWVPGPGMRLKLAEVLVDHGKGIAKFVDYSAKGSDIYEDHKRLWTISVFVHPTVTEEKTRMILAKLAQLMRVSWDRYQDQLGADPDTSPQLLAAIEVCQAGPLTERVRDLIVRASEEQAARGGDDPTHNELVQRYKALLDTMQEVPDAASTRKTTEQ